MSKLWIVIFTLTVLRNGEASPELLSEQDETTRQACASETCGPNPLPIPMAQKERTALRTNAVRMPKGYYGSRLPEGEMETDFSCTDKPHIPGFYADMEAECRIFHLCLSSEVDHFMCPPGTAFNQKDLVCEPDSQVNCSLSPTFYDVNQKLQTGPTTIPETKEVVPNEESNKWLFDLLKHEEPSNATVEDILERNLIRMLILMQFVDITDLLIDLLYLNNSFSTPTGESSRNSSEIKGEVLKRLIREVFPLLPVKFGTDPTGNVESKATVARELKSQTKKSKSMWSSPWSSDPEEVPQEEESHERPPLDITEGKPKFPRVRPTVGILGSLGSHNQEAVETAEAIVDIMGTTAGRISHIARSKLVSNYVKYIDSRLYEILEEFK